MTNRSAPTAPSSISERLYPEAAAGGFSHVDGAIEFYARINALVGPDSTVVDLGAGRAMWLDDPVEYRRELRRLKGRVARVIGLDLSPVVLENPTLDEAHVLRPGERFPVADGSIDLVVSDQTLEHVDDPAHFAREVERILRPGGWLCARTPNKWGYIGVTTRAVPNRLHTKVLRRVQPTREERDVFPTCYLLNTRSALARYFPRDRFVHCSYAMDSEPAYFGNSELAWRAARAAFRFTPERCRSTLYVFLRKR